MIEVKKPWLSSVGGKTVERLTRAPNGLPIERSGVRISFGQEPNGVLHTTEGHFGPSLNVFTKTGTPTFMLGWDIINSNNTRKSGKLRVAQFSPIGEMCLTLKNASGGTETNREALVQIELVAFCKWDAWKPDPEVMKVLADLFKQLWEVAGIPLRRAGNNSRSVARWDGASGWFGHGEVPENDHTDPRAFKWTDLFTLAAPQMVDVWQLHAGTQTVFQTDAKVIDGISGLTRIGRWIDTHEDRVRTEEKENGHIKLRRVEVPA